MAKMTEVTPMVVNNKLGEFAQLTNQMQLQPQSKPITNQVDTVDNLVEEVATLTENPIVAGGCYACNSYWLQLCPRKK